MDIFEISILLGILVLFGWIIFFMFRAEYRGRQKKRQLSRAMGFTPLDPSPELIQKITTLYHALRVKPSAASANIFELQNVATKQLPDGTMFLFDLLDTSGEDNSYVENQAVAISSPHLTLPYFLVFPKTDHEGRLAEMANQFLSWLIARFGQPIDFSQYPKFHSRYIVSSPAPETTRLFLDERKIRRLANTRLLTIYAGEQLFTCTQIGDTATPISRAGLTARIQQAHALFSIFQS